MRSVDFLMYYNVVLEAKSLKKEIEIWADSFHEGHWCCEEIVKIALLDGASITKNIVNGFQPHYQIVNADVQIDLIVYGSYKSWTPIPKKIQDLLAWGKPDFIAYDPAADTIIFAVEETAATATGNQTAQRCERQYGSARFNIPYWYLVSEYGMHKDGGARRDSIWPVVAGLKLSLYQKSPCMVVHYSDKDNLEDYNTGKGLDLLFRSLTKMIINYASEQNTFAGLKPLITEQFQDMLNFLASQWSNIVDFLPTQELVLSNDTAEHIAEVALDLPQTNASDITDFLHWPLTTGLPSEIRAKQQGKSLLKHDLLCELMENDVSQAKAYTLSSNAGSGKPRTTAEVQGYIDGQRRKFNNNGLEPSANFSLDIDDFPFTNDKQTHRHMTTAKNIVYLYDTWADFKASVEEAYPRLRGKLNLFDDSTPVFVYVSNSMKLGRIFGDPFTGQLAAYSVAFGKIDDRKRIVIAYFPHQVHNQVSDRTGGTNKGLTLMRELTDLVIFHAGVAVSLQEGEVL